MIISLILNSSGMFIPFPHTIITFPLRETQTNKPKFRSLTAEHDQVCQPTSYGICFASHRSKSGEIIHPFTQSLSIHTSTQPFLNPSVRPTCPPFIHPHKPFLHLSPRHPTIHWSVAQPFLNPSIHPSSQSTHQQYVR